MFALFLSEEYFHFYLPVLISTVISFHGGGGFPVLHYLH